MIQQCYAFKCTDDIVRRTSTSGGAFYTIAEAFIKRGGVVFGAAVMEDFLVEHICVNDIKDLYRLQGSKYLQSKIGDTYILARKYLRDGIPVLFSGTPCQISALNKFIGTNNELLFTCDIICHGVSSPLIWKEYLAYKELTLDGKITDVNFRNKDISKWSECHETISVNGRVYDSGDYAKIFYDHESMRPSCYKCRFASLDRHGDITLGDFWGIDTAHPEFYDELGVSLVICNTEKSRDLLEILQKGGYLLRADITETIQPQLYKPVREPSTRKSFWQIYNKGGINKIIEKNNKAFSAINLQRKLVLCAKRVIKKVILRGKK